jgi:putative phage-type endonuclease
MITELQRKARLNGIGGSDMPIILGLSTYKTPYQLYLEKISDCLSDDVQSALQYWGNLLEDVIREEFEQRNNVKVELHDTLTHKDHAFLLGNVDGYIKEWDCVLEVKNVSQFMAKEWGDENSDQIPLPYLVQVAHYCAVMNAKGAYIACLIGGNDYREYYYERDLVLEARLIAAATTFWDCVQTRTPPPAINIDDLRLKYPAHQPDKSIAANEPLLTELGELATVKLEIKKLNELEEKYKFNVMQFMGDAECLVNGSGEPIVSWKANKRGSRTFLLKGV